MFKVFVLSSTGVFVQHGPARKTEARANEVVSLLRKRLGWVCHAALETPAPTDPILDAGLPSPELAGLSPVWRDPGLAALWARGAREPRQPRSAPAPVATAPAPRLAPTTEGRLAALGLVLAS